MNGGIKFHVLLRSWVRCHCGLDDPVLAIPMRLDWALDCTYLLLVIGSRAIVPKRSCKPSTHSKSLALDHLGEKVITIHLLPQVEAIVLPVVSDELQVKLDARFSSVRIIENALHLAHFPCLDKIVGIVNHCNRTKSRSVILRSSPWFVVSTAIHVKLRFSSDVNSIRVICGHSLGKSPIKIVFHCLLILEEGVSHIDRDCAITHPVVRVVRMVVGWCRNHSTGSINVDVLEEVSFNCIQFGAGIRIRSGQDGGC
mmetsp:Transcript_12170/g.16824  ORF Transcript_12170/g.16824 Transcript_12170/m.16824 type:complete len:255 (+) Transcript_12170:789-1553(+)